jgi:VanZ family protein
MRLLDLPRPARIAMFSACLALVAYLCLAPSDKLPAIQSLWDKAEHALAYIFLTLSGLALSRRRAALVAGVWLFGLAIELLQAAMPYGRQGDWRDMAANSVGILIGLGLAWSAKRLRFVGT